MLGQETQKLEFLICSAGTTRGHSYQILAINAISSTPDFGYFKRHIFLILLKSEETQSNLPKIKQMSEIGSEPGPLFPNSRSHR